MRTSLATSAEVKLEGGKTPFNLPTFNLRPLLETDVMTRPTFEELRETLAMTNEGRVLDSFIAVEIGLSDYEACWDAHNDVYQDLGKEPNEETTVTLFLTEVYDMLDVEEDSFNRVLGASL